MANLDLKQLRSGALELSEAERVELVHDLVASLDGTPDPDAATAWDAEVLRRLQDVDQGTAELIDADEVARRIGRRLRGH